MKKIPPYLPASRPDRRLVLVLALCAFLLALGASRPHRAWSDAGPFPTRTPTRTPEPTETSTPEPTATFTPTPSPTTPPVLGEVTLPVITPISTPIVSPTPTPVPAGGASLFACWPIALILILAVIIASTYFLTRRARPEEMAY